MIVRYTAENEHRLRQLCDNERFFNPHYEKFLAVDDGEVLGWVMLERHGDRILIDWIFVREAYRRRGVGSQLLSFVKEHAKKLGMRGLSVHTGSKTAWARKLYEKNGFREVGRVKELFSFDPEHIFYWFRLPGVAHPP